METSKKFGFTLPSRDSDDIADINKISDNFRIIEESIPSNDDLKNIKINIDQTYNPESENAQSGIAVAEAVSYKADKIVNSASGENILLTDSSNYALEGLKVYGKSTQEGTPTPEAPIPIVSAGASGSVEVKVCGANLLPYPYVTKGNSSWGGITVTNVGDGTLVFNGTCTKRYDFMLYGDYNIKNNNIFGKKFIISGVPNIDTSNFLLSIVFYKDGVKVTEKKQAGNSLTISGIDFDGIYMHIRVYVGTTLNNVVCKPMVSLVSADYEPYTEQTLTLTTPNELRAVGSYADYIDLEKGVRVQKCKKTVFGGGEIPTDYISTTGDLTVGATVIYGLAEPIETPLTAEELAYYKALHTNYPNTTIFNSDGTNMDVSYIADTKLYIDNKFAELQALALEG